MHWTRSPGPEQIELGGAGSGWARQGRAGARGQPEPEGGAPAGRAQAPVFFRPAEKKLDYSGEDYSGRFKFSHENRELRR